MYKAGNDNFINDNRGAAIVTVLVVSAFISIIATTLLYITGRNYTSKQVDYQNKESFYQAEEVLDKLKAYMVEDVSDAFNVAYADTLTNYIEHRGSVNAENYYAQAYTEALADIWNKRKASAGTEKAAVQEFLRKRLKEEGGYSEEEMNKLVGCIQSVGSFYIPPAKDKFVITDIKVAYEPDDGYSTYITTYIGMELPELYLPDFDSTTAGYAGQEIVLTDYVKYMNWSRYDD